MCRVFGVSPVVHEYEEANDEHCGPPDVELELLPLVGYHRVRVGAVTIACVPFPACVSGAQVGHPACLSVLDRMFGACVGLPPVVPCRAC